MIYVDKKSQLLFWIAFISILLSVYMTFQRTIVDKNFDVIHDQENPA